MPDKHSDTALSQIVNTETGVQATSFIDGFRECYKLAQVLSASQIIPENYQNKPADIAIAIDMANRMNVSPMMVMQNLYVVKGKPSWSGQACMSLIQSCRKFRNVRHIYTGEKSSDDRGCYVTAVWADTGEQVDGASVTVQMAKAEGWYGKSGSKWQTMPELMLAYRASAFFARVHCPETLMGVYVEGEAEDITAKTIVEDVL
ncbi:MAG TPA: recombinase RecT [Oscillospiraceae bacterium]|nr:recombinase RecT [Oscillospiraceae bacterium]